MITKKQVVKKLIEYDKIFMPQLRAMSLELHTKNPDLQAISSLLDDSDAEVALLDYLDTISDYLRLSQRIAPPKEESNTDE